MINLGIAAAIAIIAVVVNLATTGGSDGKKTSTSSSAQNTQPQATDGDASATPAPNEPPPPEIVVKNGKPVGGITKIEVHQGDEIRFSVKADVADEVHVHAYDIHKDIEAPGDTVTFDFKADITGITEAELENAGVQIASIRVDP
jgi:hypothetical protein